MTQRGLAGPATCLAHWILLNGSVLYCVSCGVPLPTYLHTLLYTALFVTGCPRNPHLPPRKITLQPWIYSIVFDPSWIPLRRKGGHAGTINNDREIRNCPAETHRISQRNAKKKETNKKESQRLKKKNARSLSEGRYPPNKNKKIYIYINAQQQ